MGIDYSSPLLMNARNLGRKLGVLRPMQLLWRKLRGSTTYEASFERALLTGISAGDVVWDVGANIGFYTCKFSKIVGASGFVVAFEPSPHTFATLRLAVSSEANAVCQQIALSNFVGEANFYVGTEENSALSGLAERVDVPVSEVQAVSVMTGDAFVAANPHLAPHAIKIDVEGFELEVLEGMGAAFRSPSLRAVYIEIHFASLLERGLADAPRRIVEMLQNGGFSIRWTDASHIEAKRLAA